MTDKKEATELMIGDLAQSSSNAVDALYQKIGTVEGGHGLDFSAIHAQLGKHSEAVKGGDLSCAEEMLTYQSHVLNQIFNLQVMAAAQSSNSDRFEVCMRIALKAQNQTRQTLSTLAEVKGVKRTTFIKQQNQAVNQQINNSEKTDNLPSELLEKRNERLVTSEKRGSIQSNTPLEAVGAVYRAEH